jgi:hypothetical protein
MVWGGRCFRSKKCFPEAFWCDKWTEIAPKTSLDPSKTLKKTLRNSEKLNYGLSRPPDATYTKYEGRSCPETVKSISGAKRSEKAPPKTSKTHQKNRKSEKRSKPNHKPLTYTKNQVRSCPTAGTSLPDHDLHWRVLMASGRRGQKQHLPPKKIDREPSKPPKKFK